jgi:hypothetical protein
MERITGFAAGPPTLASLSCNATGTTMATSTVTKTATKTLSYAVSAATTTVTVNGNPTSSAPVSDIPAHLLEKITKLYASAPVSRYSGITELVHMSPVLKVLLGVAVASGVAVLCHCLPTMDPPAGEDQRTWRQKVQFGYNFLKNAANANEELRRDIEKAHQDKETAHQARDRAYQARDQARREKRAFEAIYTGTDSESSRLKRDMDLMSTQKVAYQQEIHDFRTENAALKNQIEQLLAAEDFWGSHLSLLLNWARTESVQLQTQVDQLTHDKNFHISELQRVYDEHIQLETDRDDLKNKLASAQAEKDDFLHQTQILQESNQEVHRELKAFDTQAKQLQQALDLKKEELKEADESNQLSQQLEEELRQDLESEKQQRALVDEKLADETRKRNLAEKNLAEETEQRSQAENSRADETRKRTAVEDELARLKTRPEPAQPEDSEFDSVSFDQALQAMEQRYKDSLEIQEQDCIKAKNDLANEIKRHALDAAELSRVKERLARARTGPLSSGRKSGLPFGPVDTPSQPKTNSQPLGAMQSTPLTTVRKAGLDASPPSIPSSAAQGPVPETPSLQIEKEISTSPVPSSPSAGSDGTPSRKRSRYIKDDGNQAYKKIKSEPDSDTGPMETDDQPAASRKILDTDDQVLSQSRASSIFDNAPTFRRPDQVSSPPPLSSPRGPPPPRPTAPTPRRGRRAPSVDADPATVRRSTRHVSKLPSLNERDLSRRSEAPSVPSQQPRRPAPGSPTKPTTRASTRSQSPRKR